MFDTPSDRALARRAAAASIVLLQDRDGLLPLDPAAPPRIAVIGPAADDERLLQGDYHYPAHLEINYENDAGFDQHAAGDGATSTFGEEYLPAQGGAFRPGPHFVEHVTPLAGIRAAVPGAEIVLRRGLRGHR